LHDALPISDARERGVLRDLAGRVRRDPVEGREPARARRRGAEDHGPGPAAARRHRRDRARTPGRRPRRPRRRGRDARRGAAPPPGPARQAADRQAPQTARGEVPFHGCSLAEGAPPAVERKIVRRAGADDTRTADQLHSEEESVRRAVGERAEAHGLAMKMSDVEWQWDRRKLTIYFTAEQRVDFRAL